MKKIILVSIILVGSFLKSKGQQPVITDTLQWLKVNIEQRNNLYAGKPLKILLDSLYDLKTEIRQYLGPVEKSWQLHDTIWTEQLALYFGERFGSSLVAQQHRANPRINTHVPVIYVKFAWPVPYLGKWIDTDRRGLGSVDWNKKLEDFWGQEYVLSVTVGEY